MKTLFTIALILIGSINSIAQEVKGGDAKPKDSDSMPVLWSDEKCVNEQIELLKERKPGKQFENYLKDATKACNNLFKKWRVSDNAAIRELRSNPKCTALMQSKIISLQAEFERFKPFGNVSDDYIKREIEAATEIYDCYHAVSPDYATRYKMQYEESHQAYSRLAGSPLSSKGVEPFAALNPDSPQMVQRRDSREDAVASLARSADALRSVTGQPPASEVARNADEIARNTRDAAIATRRAYIIPRPVAPADKSKP